MPPSSRRNRHDGLFTGLGLLREPGRQSRGLRFNRLHQRRRAALLLHHLPVAAGRRARGRSALAWRQADRSATAGVLEVRRVNSCGWRCGNRRSLLINLGLPV